MVLIGTRSLEGYLQVRGVSESIIMGIPMPLGTGLFKIFQNAPPAGNVLPPPRPPPLLAYA